MEQLYQQLQQQIRSLESELASDLVQTPYVRLLAIPWVNVVSAAELAGEMGPISLYANANAITGRRGLYPSRYQSDQTDRDRGRLIRQAIRRLRTILMRIADNLVRHCAYYRGQAELSRVHGIDERALRVKIGKKFTRLYFACVAGDQPLRHPSLQSPDSILEKLRVFHFVHGTSLDRVLQDLQTAVAQLLPNTRNHEAKIVEKVLTQKANNRRGVKQIGSLLPAVLARLKIDKSMQPQPRDRS